MGHYSVIQIARNDGTTVSYMIVYTLHGVPCSSSNANHGSKHGSLLDGMRSFASYTLTNARTKVRCPLQVMLNSFGFNVNDMLLSLTMHIQCTWSPQTSPATLAYRVFIEKDGA